MQRVRLVCARMQTFDIREDEVGVKQTIDSQVHLTEVQAIHLELHLQRQTRSGSQTQRTHAPARREYMYVTTTTSFRHVRNYVYGTVICTYAGGKHR